MDGMEVETPSDLLVRRGVLGALMVGLALAFIIYGREPGVLPYLAGGALALIFLLSAFTKWRRTGWIGILAYIILVSSLMTSRNGILGTLLGLFLAALVAFQPYEEVEDEASREADGTLDRFQSDSP